MCWQIGCGSQSMSFVVKFALPRLMYTAGTFAPPERPSVLTSQTSCAASYAVTVSLARDSGPPHVLSTPPWIVSGSSPVLPRSGRR